MKYIILVIGLLGSLSAVVGQEVDPICKGPEHIAAMEAQHFEQKIHGERNVLTNDYDVNYHRLEWEIDPAAYYIKGAITTYFSPTNEGFDQIHFDFVNNMKVNYVLYHGDTLTSNFSEAEILQIDLPSVIGNGVLDSITVQYEGAPKSGGFGSFEASSHGNNNDPVLWTLSEPYGAKAWWPCKQDLKDKIDSIDIYIKTDVAYRAASNGKLVEEIAEGSSVIYHWKHRYPVAAYLVAIAVTNYSVFSDYVMMENGDSIEILNYVYPEDFDYYREQYRSTVEILGFYNDKFGLYPFADEKYGHAQFGWGGGMEHQTMSFMGGASYALQAHELAHQWFGDKVTCGSWQDIWLNEGFATYLTGLTNEFLKDESKWITWKYNNRGRVLQFPDGSVSVDDTTSVSRIFNSRLSYSKGAFVLHMLRNVVGDDHFFQACRNYLDDPDLAYSYARTEDLRRHFEAVSGKDLSSFFDNWIYGQGYPKYELSWQSTGENIVVTLDQTTSDNSVDFFEMPVQIQFVGTGVDSIVTLNNSYSGESFSFEMPFEVETISFDPNINLLGTGVIKQVISSTEQRELITNAIVTIPNPFLESLTLELKDLNHLSIESVKVYNLLGQLQLQRMVNDEKVTINTQDWKPGVYIIKVEAGGKVGNKMVVKE